MVCVSALLVIPFILSEELCAGKEVNLLRTRLISSTFVASGISTIIQTSLGMRQIFYFLFLNFWNLD